MTRSIEAAALAPGASLSHTLGLRYERTLLPTTRSAAGLRRPSVTKPLWTAHRADPMVLRRGIPARRRDPSAGGITAVSAQLHPRPHSAAAGETNKWIRHRFRSSGHHPRIRLPRGRSAVIQPVLAAEAGVGSHLAESRFSSGAGLGARRAGRTIDIVSEYQIPSVRTDLERLRRRSRRGC